MKRPLAYITAPWGDNDFDNRQNAARYCRQVYEAGYSPICPILYLPCFLHLEIPREAKDRVDMAAELLRRSRILVVCGSKVTQEVKNDIALAKHLRIAATTLEGILTVDGNHYGWESGDGEDPEPEDPDAGSTDEGENGSGNTNNTGGSQNQSGILFPEEGEVSELEDELIGMIKTSGHEKNYELIEYVNDVNRENAEVLMELNINGKMDTAYSYGNERLTAERFDGWTGYYTYDPRGSVSGVTGSDGYLWQSYRYDPFGDISFGKPQYNNVYAYNAESFNPNLDTIYLRARYYYTSTANFLSEDTYLGDISDPLTLNRYNYVKSSYLNYVDPSGKATETSLQGIEAHALLQGYLKAVMPDNVLVERQINNYYDKNGNPKIGRADIIYMGEYAWEVYEIKPISNLNGSKYNNAQAQRNRYVDAIATQGIPINREGKTLNPVVNNVILKSVGWADDNLYYRYSTYEDKPGMIFYERVKNPEEVRAYDEQVEKARELLRAGLCEQKEVLQPEIVLDGKTLVTAAGITIVVVGGVAIISGTGGGAAAIAFVL